MMKKSTFGAVLAFLFAAAGALTAAAIYLYRREKELDEYERLLFNDEYEDEADDDFDEEPVDEEPVYEKIQDEPVDADMDDAAEANEDQF